MKKQLIALIILPCCLYASQDADLLFEATLYEDAIPLYQQMLEENPSGSYRLALSYYHTKQYQKAVHFLEELPNISPQEKYLLALCLNQLSKFSEASEQLKQILELRYLENPEFSFDVLFELGRTYYLWDKTTAARELFVRLEEEGQYRIPAQIYLIRMDLDKELYDDANLRLQAIRSNLKEDSLQKFETFYHLGQVALRQENFLEAIEMFCMALPRENPEKASWYAEVQYHLGLCYLGVGEEGFERSVEILETLIESDPSERNILALGRVYLEMVKLGDTQAEEELNRIFTQNPHLKSRDGQNRAILLLAEASPSFEARDQYYRQLTQEGNRSSPFYGRAWYLRGLNNFQEMRFLEACNSFSQAFLHLMNQDKHLALLSVKHEAESHYRLGNISEALEALDRIREDPDAFELEFKDLEEIDYSYALIAFHSTNNEQVQLAKQMILEKGQYGSYGADNLYLLGIHQYRDGELTAAAETFLKIAQLHPNSSLVGDAFFWAANCVEETAMRREYLQKVFQEYPNSSYAAEAYFTYYPYQEYMQGDRTAVKHLENFQLHFPLSPYRLHVDYLLGMDFKRDRKTPEGKWIRKQNLSEAIDAFRRVEKHFDELSSIQSLDSDKWKELVKVRYRAMLERGRTCLEVARRSQGAKERIHLEYSDEVFRKIRTEFSSPDNKISAIFQQDELYPILDQESHYLFAKTLITAKKEREAERELFEMLSRYNDEKITRGYFLSRVWYELALLAMEQEDSSLALEYFSKSEEAAKGNILSSDEKLDLWIQQSLCFQNLGNLNEAMLTLSNVINSDAVSGLRLKAMYLRSELYELQGRHELAKNQLEATASKGGVWAQKAKQKLEEKYVY